jgi:hypothetical protein
MSCSIKQLILEWSAIDTNQRKLFLEEMAFGQWSIRYHNQIRRCWHFHQVDAELASWFSVEPSGPWLRRIREVLFLTLRSVSERMGIHRASLLRLEQSELERTIAKLSTTMVSYVGKWDGQSVLCGCRIGAHVCATADRL